MRRRAVVAVLLTALLIPLTARADDLDDMLEGSDDAAFSGIGIVMASWDSDSVAAMYEITRSDGMTMVHGPEGDLMLSGSLSASRTSTSAWTALELGGWSEWSMSDRYDVGEVAAVRRFGRPATEVSVLEGDLVRARLIVDDASTVPLLTEVFDDAGVAYRVTAMIEFAEGPAELHMPEEAHEPEMMMQTDASRWLPGEAAGYTRSDTYGMEGATQAFYSDGLFSFSVFETGRGPIPEPFRDATPLMLDGAVYRRILTPSVVWIQWDAPDRSYVLVGDLPPDHLEAVLAELPEPGKRNIWVRLWRRLFG